MCSNYYDVLNISEDSSYSEVRKAYRNLVKEYHPDVSSHPDAQIRFQQVKEAYEVLNHRKKRQQYHRLSHDKFVSRYGGYSSDELEQTTEVHLVSHNTVEESSQTDSSSKTRASTDHARTASVSSNPTESDSSTSLPSLLFNWILQGRTSDNGGLFAYLARISLYIFMLYFVGEFIKLATVGFRAFSTPTSAIAVILFTRLIYLSGFEYLRSSHSKIDNQPEPDAYAIPYSIVIGFGGFVLVSVTSLVLEVASFSGISSELLIIDALGWALYLVGWVGTILTVGWGVADDYYNLGIDVNPLFWNFAVQAPLLVTLTLMSLVQDQLSEILLLAVATLPFVVGSLYITIYHPELVDEFRWRFNNRTIFSIQ